jgi:tetratricopeptide (TPR) repeat protein
MTDMPRWLDWLGRAQAIVTDPYRQNDLPALREAVDLLRRVDAALPPEFADQRPALAGMLGGALTSVFELDPQRPLIDEAIRILSPVADVFAVANLSAALRARHRQFGLLDDLRRAAEVARRAVREAEAPDAELDPYDRAGLLANSGMIAQELHAVEPDEATLRDAVSALRAAVAMAPDHPERYRWIGNLGNTYVLMYHSSGSVERLDDAIHHFRQIAPDTVPAPFRPAHLANLGGALAYRFARTGSRADLDEAVRLFRDAARQSAGTRDPGPHHGNLAQALLQRFRLLGAVQDVDEAIAAARQACVTIPESHVTWATAATALGGALTARFERTGARDDLDAAVEAYRRAVAAIPDGHLDRPGALSNLGGALVLRHRVGRDPRDLAEAVRFAAMAVSATAPSDPARGRHLGNLSWSLLGRAETTGDRADIDEAVAAARAAAELLPVEPASAVTCLRSLGSMLVARHRMTGRAADRAEAARVLRRAARISAAPYLNRAVCAQTAATMFAPEDWPAAADCMAEATQLVVGLAARDISRSGRETFLARFSGTAVDAAATAVQTDDPRRAVALLEQGRAVLLAQMLETRQNLDRIRAVRPDLADRLTWIGRLLDQDESQGIPGDL